MPRGGGDSVGSRYSLGPQVFASGGAADPLRETHSAWKIPETRSVSTTHSRENGGGGGGGGRRRRRRPGRRLDDARECRRGRARVRAVTRRRNARRNRPQLHAKSNWSRREPSDRRRRLVGLARARRSRPGAPEPGRARASPTERARTRAKAGRLVTMAIEAGVAPRSRRSSAPPSPPGPAKGTVPAPRTHARV